MRDAIAQGGRTGFETALVVPLFGPTEAILEQIVGMVDEEPSKKVRALCERASSTGKDPGALALAIAQDACHRKLAVVAEDPARGLLRR